MNPYLALLLILLASLLCAGPRRRRGVHVNDLRRWKRFGGTIERPAPPAPIRKRAS